MAAYILRRLIYAVVVTLIAGMISFTLMHLAPGDPAGLMLGSDASVEQIKALRKTLELDRPLIVQFSKWLQDVLRGDFGRSIYFHLSVIEVIAGRTEATLILTALSTIIVIVIGIPIGILSAVRYGSVMDELATAFAMLVASIPSFWLGMIFILFFAVKLRLLPSSGYINLHGYAIWSTLRHLIMPAFCLGIPNSALVLRVTRSSMLDELNKDYLRTSRSKGLSELLVIIKHALRNASVPIVTVIGLTIATLIGGAVVTENVFAIPGLGRLVVQSVLRRDFPVIQGVVMLSAIVYLIINLIVDISYIVLDPRIRY